MNLMKITTLLLDCDNTLVQPESIAFEASADLTNEILAARKVDLSFTGSYLQLEFVGQNFQNMFNVSCNISDKELEHYVSMEDDRVISKLMQNLELCDGANAELERLKGHYRLAVVSSSALRHVRASFDEAGQANFFDPSDVFSAADSLPVPTSKPDPAVNLHVLKVMGKSASECVARAGIITVGYTGACEMPEEADALCIVLGNAGCHFVMSSWDEFPDILRKIKTHLME
ncbi:HAD-like domain-containing protein [Fusarium oxysporum]|nr:HAD-like domain-containing protein [Fusarium oxysporum]